MRRIFGGKKKFSLENGQHLCSEVKRLKDEGRPDDLVEALREMVEVVVWGDKNEEAVFDLFLENQLMGYFTELILTKDTPSTVRVQVIQCLTILLQNLTREQSVFFVCSNNYINSIINYDVDEDDEDLLSNFVSMLKTLSLRLNEQSAQFFFSPAGMPLYEKAARLFDHDDRMVRTACRSVVVHILQLKDKAIAQFLENSMDSLFSTLCGFLTQQIRLIDRRLSTITKFKNGLGAMSEIISLNALETVVEDLIDDFYYFNDMALLPQETIRRKLVEAVQSAIIDHLLLESLEDIGRPLSSDQSDTRVLTPFVLLLLGKWIKVNTVPDLHRAMVHPLLFGTKFTMGDQKEVVPNTPLLETKVEGGLLCAALRSPRLAVYPMAVGVIQAILKCKLCSDEERAAILGPLASSLSAPVVYPLRGEFSLSFETIPMPELDANLCALVPGEFEHLNLTASDDQKLSAKLEKYVPLHNRVDQREQGPSRVTLSSLGPDLHRRLLADYPFIFALAEACLHTIAYKEAAALSVFEILLSNLVFFAKHIQPEDLAAIFRVLMSAATANIVLRACNYSNHLFMILGGTSESSITPESLLTKLLDSPTSKEITDARAVLFVRLEYERENAKRHYAKPDQTEKVTKNVRTLYPLFPSLSCWKPELAAAALDGDVGSCLDASSKYLELQSKLTRPTPLEDRAPLTEAEIESVETLMFYLLRMKYYGILFNETDPLINILDNFFAASCDGSITGSLEIAAPHYSSQPRSASSRGSVAAPSPPSSPIRNGRAVNGNFTQSNATSLTTSRAGSPQSAFTNDAIVSLGDLNARHGVGIRCEYVHEESDILQSSPTKGTVLYLYITANYRHLLLVEPDRPAEPFGGTGRVVLSLQTFYTEAIIASKQRFKVALVFETPATIRKITLVVREKSVCRSISQRVQSASLHARNEGAAIVQTLLGK